MEREFFLFLFLLFLTQVTLNELRASVVVVLLYGSCSYLYSAYLTYQELKISKLKYCIAIYLLLFFLSAVFLFPRVFFYLLCHFYMLIFGKLIHLKYNFYQSVFFLLYMLGSFYKFYLYYQYHNSSFSNFNFRIS